MKKIYIILTVLVVAIVIGVMVGLRMYNKENPNTRDLKANVKVEIPQMAADFKADTAKARKKYDNKTISMHGTIEKIEKDHYGHTYFWFSANDVKIQCLMQSDDSVNVAAVHEKQEVKIKGQYKGFMQGDDPVDPQAQLQFSDCIIEK